MTGLNYSLTMEATIDPGFGRFYSTGLGGITGVGNPVEDCLHNTRWRMEERVAAPLEFAVTALGRQLEGNRNEVPRADSVD